MDFTDSGVLSDAVFKQDRFERLRSLGDDLLLLLGAVQQDVVKVSVSSAFVLRRIRGKRVLDKTGKEILVFDLHANQGFEKPTPKEKGKNRSTILTGWNGVFGPRYHESESTLHVDTFDGYSFFSIKEGWVRNTDDTNHEQGVEDRNEAEDEQ